MGMNVIPILTDKLACLGICCERHAKCAHYSLVDGSEPGQQIGTCMTADGYPLFVAAETAPAGQVSA